MSAPILQMEGIVKDFGATRALDHVDFGLRAGEVHALIGENGAGKSTLMNVLAGRFPDYQGRIVLFGQDVRLASPRQALALGIGVIYQDLSVLPNLTVAENILLGHEPAGGLPGTLNRRLLRKEAATTLAILGFDLPLDEPVGRLSHAKQCLVEIAHALRSSPPSAVPRSACPTVSPSDEACSRPGDTAGQASRGTKDVRVLVFDEPTAALGREDVQRLFEVIRDLKSKGLGIVYISHRLAELPEIADRATVLRDGKAVGTRDIAACKVSDLSRMMLGRKLTEMFPPRRGGPDSLPKAFHEWHLREGIPCGSPDSESSAYPPEGVKPSGGPPLLRVEGLTRPGVFEDISFELREGEILGIAGLVGSGRTEIARAIFGADKAAGRVELEGKDLSHRSPQRCMASGIGMIQEDRKSDGAIRGLSVAVNLGISVLDRLSGALGFLAPRRLRNYARDGIQRLNVVPPDPDKEIQLLSGGNQQKVVIARCLSPNPRVLLFDEPTQGIDVGTKAQIYRLMVDLASEGKGIILISSEFIEIVELADRILVIQDGRLIRELPGPGMDVDALFAECVRKDTA